MLQRYKIYEISVDYLKEIFTEGTEVRFKIVEGLPLDAKLIDFTKKQGSLDTLQLLIESETFEEIPKGHPFPIGEPLVAETIL